VSKLEEILEKARKEPGLLLFLTGAGISAESGIPTFRGKDGFWTAGSKVYRPEELATFSTFRSRPGDVWEWYLLRRETCLRVEPNAAHHALVKIEEKWGDRFRLITQNVDGLHLRAGNSLERTWQIHGDINLMRCAAECTDAVQPVGDGKNLRCDRCGDWMRPHVLWFDEYYNEEWYRFESSLAAASGAALLVVVGTSGATNLPIQVGMRAAERGAYLVDVNPEPNPFSEWAESSPRGKAVTGKASERLPRIAELLLKD